MRLFLRKTLRCIAGALMLAAVLGIFHDVTRSSTSHSSFVATSVGEIWSATYPASLERARVLVNQHIPRAAEAHFLDQMLQLPVWLVAGVLGGLLFLLSRRRGNRIREARNEAARPNSRAAVVPAEPGSEIRAALASCRGAFLGIGLFSALINILALTGALFMLEIYDRVLPSRSIPTLVGLSIVAVLLFSSQGLLDLLRGRPTAA